MFHAIEGTVPMMGEYTRFLGEMAEIVSPEDDDFEERLTEVMGRFRPFGEALTEFMGEHGYAGRVTDGAVRMGGSGAADGAGGLHDIDEKVRFLQGKFKSAGIPAPRGMREWFDVPGGYGVKAGAVGAGAPIRIKSDTAYQICYAFLLDFDETVEFFQKVCLERAFDCHTIKGAVHYYCFRHGLGYQDAQSILALLPGDDQGCMPAEGEVLYTDSIVEILDGAGSPEELVRYINDNISHFGYNHATAVKFVRGLWSEIAGEGTGEGALAYQEGSVAMGWSGATGDMRHGTAKSGKTKGTTDKNAKAGDDKSRDDKAKNAKSGDARAWNEKAGGEKSGDDEAEPWDAASDDEAFINVSIDGNSDWHVYCQILGLDRYQASRYGDRSIKGVLEDNRLLQALAAASFPDRDGIVKAVHGAHISNERMRKLLILLLFYAFWARRNISAKSDGGSRKDAQRCLDDINHYLSDAGYHELYYGNPYDWIFLWAMADREPLSAFRLFMTTLFAVKGEEVAAKV